MFFLLFKFFGGIALLFAIGYLLGILLEKVDKRYQRLKREEEERKKLKSLRK